MDKQMPDNKPPQGQIKLTVLNDELIGFRNLLWTLGRCRKEARCRMTGSLIPKGSKAWRPLGNPATRYERISESWMSQQRGTVSGQSVSDATKSDSASGSQKDSPSALPPPSLDKPEHQ